MQSSGHEIRLEGRRRRTLDSVDEREEKWKGGRVEQGREGQHRTREGS